MPKKNVYDKLLEEASKEYKRLKMEKYPYRAPETLPAFDSDHGRAILKAVADHLNSRFRYVEARLKGGSRG